MKTFLCKTGNLLSAIVKIKFIVKYSDVIRNNIDEISSIYIKQCVGPCVRP